MALLSLTKMLESLLSTTTGFPPPDMDIDEEEMEQWRSRARRGFFFVRSECVLAGKVLDFGMQQVRMLGISSPAELIQAKME